ncbi:unnamed protein product [Sphagnum balticum]
MNADTERRLAAMIEEEAAVLRKQADRDGVAAYLAKPVVKARPNRQFLSAMVRSVEQSNRIVEVNDMWRLRSVELEYENQRARRRKESFRGMSAAREMTADRRDSNGESSQKDTFGYDDRGLNDEDLEHFLQSRVKRGRGAVGSRMDEPGPYLQGAQPIPDTRQKEDWEDRIAGPVAGPLLMSGRFAAVDPIVDNHKHKKEQKVSMLMESAIDSSEEREEELQRQELKKRRRKKEKKRARELERHSKSKKRQG